MEIIKTISDWPVIIQGALGSALFWAILELGQKGGGKLINFFGKNRETDTTFSLFAYASDKFEISTRAFLICIYGALHYSIKGLIVLVLSISISEVNSVFSVTGNLIAIYFFFRAVSFVPHSEMHGSGEDRGKRFSEAVKKRLSKKPDAS